MHADFRHNHFELFGFSPAFQIDVRKLEAAYREFQRRVHPDRYAQAADNERRLALQWATRANEAYRTLKKPVLRARYLLGLRGVELADTTAALPNEFLIEQMEWREALADAKGVRDMVALERLDTTVGGRTEALHDRLARQLDAENDHAGAAATVHKLMFLEKLVAEIADASAALED